MPPLVAHVADLPPIRFEALNAALLQRIGTLVPAWLPGGKTVGGEYVVHSIWRSEKSPSLSVRMSGENVGRWGDFGGSDKGNDLLSLYAAIHGLSQGKAALQLAHELGLEDVAGIVHRGSDAAHAPPPPPPPPSATRADKREAESWRTAVPVPDFAPPAPFRHQYRKAEEITHTAAYRLNGHLLGYVVRFRTSDGGKQPLPYTWCLSERDGRCCWHWRQWDEPRPLYLPGGRSVAAVQGERMEPPTVVVVEGERKADLLHRLLDEGAPGVYVVVSWPGGSKAWKKALWDWLTGLTVLLWPDCDGKREALTKAEREQHPDEVARAVVQAAKPLLPAHKQVGMAAMLGIGELLRSERGCSVQMLPIPEPGEVTDGWDAADAIETDGWDFAAVQAFFGRAQPLPPVEASCAADGAPGASAGPSRAGGGGAGLPPSGDAMGQGGQGDGDDDAFIDHLARTAKLMECEVYQLPVNRKMVISALRKARWLKACVGFNEMAGGACTREPWPWRDVAGPMGDADALRLGDYLSATYHLKAASKAALEEAIDTVADEHRFHPVRDWLVAQEHDGTSRIDKWFIHVLGLDPELLGARKARYLAKVGRYVLLGLVARVMQPGIKFDYSLVLEGKTGLGKSTLFKTLVGEAFFSDTHFDIGVGKDGFEQFEGLWGYELSELTALRRADSEQVKQFFSSTVDRFRGAYGRYVQAHPRQCVIFCSTNKRQYLYDLTGNRRFWPVWVANQPRVEWLEKWRAQLFAEALALFRVGERIFPTREEEAELFVPEQERRLVETAVQARLFELLTREGAQIAEGKATAEINQNTVFVTLAQLVTALGADAAKSTPQLEAQVRGWLEARGWVWRRESTGQRRYGYRPPEIWPPAVTEAEQADEDDDGGAAGAVSQQGGSAAPDAGARSTKEGADHAPF